ncbi:hypothetical protein Godav_019053, partial [Gossypium davidsonii]|nr:hypothetical protein [Gossypium davidsonii]
KVVNILDIATQEGNNALHNAARYGHKLLVREIIKERPSLTFKINHKGETPVHVATRFGRRDIIEFLIKEMKDYKGIHIGKMRDKFGNTPSHGIARNANFKVMAALAANDTESLRRINNMGESPLSIAISMRLTNFAARIIDFNPETLDDIGHNGQTPLHVAIKRNDFEVMSVNQNWSKSKMKEEDSPSLCIMLLFNKDSIVAYIKDNNKKIPLYLAAEKGSIGMQGMKNLFSLIFITINIAIHAFYRQFSLPNTTTQLTLNGAYKFMNPEDVLENPRLDDMKVEIPAKFGMAVLISKAAFKAFVISDSIAMTSSITAAVIVFWSSSRRDAESFMDTLPFANWFDLDLTHSNGVTENTMLGHIGLCHRPKGHSVCVGGYVVVAENANALLHLPVWTFSLCDSASL